MRGSEDQRHGGRRTRTHTLRDLIKVSDIFINPPSWQQYNPLKKIRSARSLGEIRQRDIAGQKRMFRYTFRKGKTTLWLHIAFQYRPQTSILKIIAARSCVKTLKLKMLTSPNESAYFCGRTRTREADGLAFYITIYGPIHASIYKHGICSSDVFALSLLVRLARAKSRDEPFTFARNLQRATAAAAALALNQKQNFCRGSTRLREQSTGCGANPSPVMITMKKEEVNVARRRTAFPRLPPRQEGKRAYRSCTGGVLRNYKF